MAPAICTVTGTVYGLDGAPIEGTQVTARIASADDDMGGQIIDNAGVVSDPIEVFTDDVGAFSIALIQGTAVLFAIPSINLRKQILVPAASSVDFSTLI
jgi:hypothetical protein